MRLSERLEALVSEARADRAEGGFGYSFVHGQSQTQELANRLGAELRWYQTQKRALLRLVDDRGGIVRAVNVRTGEVTTTSSRPSVDDLIAGLEESYGELPQQALLSLRLSLLKGGYIPEQNRAAAMALDLTYHPEPKKRGIFK